MPTPKHKFIGSTPTRELMIDKLNQYFYSIIRLVEVTPHYWSVYNNKGRIEGCRVTLTRGKYRFEMEIPHD